jgi:hypothetical protein
MKKAFAHRRKALHTFVHRIYHATAAQFKLSRNQGAQGFYEETEKGGERGRMGCSGRNIEDSSLPVFQLSLPFTFSS